jgi:hypothetical protein
MLAAVFLGISIICVWAQPVVPLHWLNPSTQENNLYGVTYGNGKYVAVGALGTTLSSADGTNWQGNYAPEGFALNAVCWGNGQFVAVGSNGVIMASADGINWTNRASPTTAPLLSATFGNGVFVAGGDNGTILSSTDTTNWSIRSSGISAPITSVAFGNNIFLGISTSSGFTNAQAVFSSDGSSWTASSIPAVPGYGFGTYSSVTYGNGRFLSPGWTTTNASSFVAQTTNGVDWTAYDLPPYSIGGGFYANYWLPGGYPAVEVQYGAGQFVSLIGNFEFASSDGTNWTGNSIGSGFWLSAICYGANGFVGVGPAGAIAVSPDAKSWTYAGPADASVHTSDLTGIAASGSTIVAVGNLQTVNTALLVSTNSGATWQDNDNAGEYLDVAYGNGVFVAVGGYSLGGGSGIGLIQTSTNGLDWTAGNSMLNTPLTHVTFANGVFGIVAANGSFAQTTNGTVSSLTSTGYAGALNGVAYSGATFVAVGNGGTIVASPDGGTWSGQSSGVSNNLSNVAYGSNQFVAVGQSGAILSSPDGTNWSAQYSGVTNDIGNVFFGNGIFGAVTYSPNGNLLLTSVDGTNWYPVVLPTPYGYATATVTPSGFLFAGANDAIAQTGTLPRLISTPGFTGQGFQFSFYGNLNQTYTLQSSLNATNWTDVYAFTVSHVPTTVIDTVGSSNQFQFYRMVSP